MKLKILTAMCGATVALFLAAPSPNAQIINTLRGFEDAPGWSGAVQAQLAVADGNTEYFESDLSTAVQYGVGENRWRLMAQHTRRTANGTEIVENALGHVRHNYQVKPWLASILFVQAQRNPFRRIERRTLAGAGARLDMVRKEDFEASFGASYMREVEDLTDDDKGAAGRDRASLFLTALGKPRDGVQIDATVFYQPLLDDLSAARAYTVASVRVNIVGGLYFTANYTLTSDSDPPPGVVMTDQAVRSGLGWKF